MKQFFTRWKKGILTLSPLTQLRAKRNGLMGQVIGMIFAIIVMSFQGWSFFLPFLVFVLFTLIIDLIGVHQQVRQIESFGGKNDV